MVEVPTALENLPDNYIFGGYAVKELRQLRDEEGIDKVVELLKNKCYYKFCVFPRQRH